MPEDALEANKQVAREFIAAADVVSRKEADWEVMRSLTTPSFQLHTPDEDLSVDFDGFIKMSGAMMQGFPGFHHEIEFQVAEGDKVVNRIILHGVHSGTFNDVAPTRRSVHMAIINIMRFEAGKIAEFWRLSDIGGLMRQITT